MSFVVKKFVDIYINEGAVSAGLYLWSNGYTQEEAEALAEEIQNEFRSRGYTFEGDDNDASSAVS